MKNVFSTETIHTVTDANINYYAEPFVHPRRNMTEHDFIYLLHGEWSFGQNDTIYELKKDNLLILTAGNTHFGAAACKVGTKTMYFHVTREEGDRSFTSDQDTDEGRGINTFINTSENKNIKKLFREIVNSTLSGNKREAGLYFELLLCELQKTHSVSLESETARTIRNVIHSYPEKFFGNAELAKMVNVSTKTAETKFKTAFGMTIHQYILDYKIREALSYFNTFEDITVKEVAFNLGFYDEYHFSKQFKKLVGISPFRYKKQIIKD